MKAEAAERRAARNPLTTSVPGTYLGFLDWVGVTATPGQAELARVAYDGAQPVDAGLAARLFGTQDLSLGLRSIVAAVCGGRAGKSYLLVALRLVWGMLVRDVSALPPGAHAAALIIAPRDDLRMEVYRYAIGAVRAKPELAAMLVEEKVDKFKLRRPDGHIVSFETGVATMGGTAARGRWWTDFALDECAFFRDSTFKVNDEELFRAGSSRVLKGGQTIIASTPWAEGGLLYRLWKTRPADTLVAHAPTLLLNDTDLTRTIIARAEQADADNAKREFGAEFMTSGTTVFFSSSAIDDALTDALFELEPGDVVSAGADMGLISDSAALVKVAKRGDELHVYFAREERPQEGRPLRLDATVEAFVKDIVGASYAMADQHYFQALHEALEKHDLVLAKATAKPADAYTRGRVLIHGGKVKIHTANMPPEVSARLVQQLREVQGRPTSGGGVSISNPRWAQGGHGDIAAALMLALWQLSGDVVAAPAPEAGSREWEEARRDARRRKLTEKAETPEWRRYTVHDRGDGAGWRK